MSASLHSPADCLNHQSTDLGIPNDPFRSKNALRDLLSASSSLGSLARFPKSHAPILAKAFRLQIRRRLMAGPLPDNAD
jgi:hypothetical protein